MKILKMMMCAALAMMVATSCNPKKEAPKMLVLYYSQTSNTKTVAQEIATRLNADIEEIVPVQAYDGDFEATIQRCMKEREEGTLPEIKPLTSDISKYDVIFIGYPIWFGTFAPPVGAFLSQVDLSGKTVVPFCTFGSGGLESSINDLKEKQPNAEIRSGYGVRAARMDAVPKEVGEFLAANFFIDGKFEMPEPFPEQHPVSADEEAIFNTAVDGYPMLNAKALTVASRAIADGTEYLFTAQDIRRDVKPEDSQLTSEIKVYVLVEKDAKPVFTKVVR